MRKRILINNFFATVFSRGIPVYTNNLCAAFVGTGAECRIITCPKWIAKLDRRFINIAFVIYEQLLIPVLGFMYDATIYPYNSTCVAGAVCGRSLTVVHDFVPNKRSNKSISSLYIKITQGIHSKLGGDVAYISQNTAKCAMRTMRFRRSATFLFPNGFYLFQRELQHVQVARQEHILLCTGWGANKDLAGALALYRESGLWEMRELRILGISGHQEVVDEFRSCFPMVARQISVLRRLEDSEVVAEFQRAAWTWVHSLKEGFGRPITEARICGSRVVASDITPFRGQADRATFFYRGLEEFKGAVARCEAYPASAPRRVPPEHEVLEAEIQRFYKHLSANTKED